MTQAAIPPPQAETRRYERLDPVPCKSSFTFRVCFEIVAMLAGSLGYSIARFQTKGLGKSVVNGGDNARHTSENDIWGEVVRAQSRT